MQVPKVPIKKYDSLDDSQGSVLATIRLVFIFFVIAYIFVAPIVYYRHSTNPFMRLMWMDSNEVMDNVTCATIWLRCK